MDSEVDAVHAGKGRFEIKFKLDKFAGWKGGLAAAEIEWHSMGGGKPPFPTLRLCVLN